MKKEVDCARLCLVFFFLSCLLYVKPFTLSQSKKEGYGPGGVFVIPKLKPFNSSKHCFECGVVFSLFKQKYHCRNCGNVVCSNCSDHKHSLKKFGYENPVRCCNTCDRLINMQNMNSNELSNLSPKVLKEYINAYQLPSKAAIEKSDLVRIIFNTKPISNENECYYRSHRTRPSLTTNDTNEGGGSSFVNVLQDLFTPLSNNASPQQSKSSSSSTNAQREQQQQQRQREEQSKRDAEARHMQQLREQQEQARRMQQQQEQARRMRQQQEQAERERLERQQRERYRQQQQQQSSASQSRSSTPLSNSDNLLSLHDMIKANIDPSSLSVRTLKSILKANYVEQSHVLEKSELVKLVVRLVDSYKAEHENGNDSDKGGGGSGGNEDTLCRICFDAQQNCVFLDCGHMVTCMDCAKKLIESKNECPICREPILKLVHVFRS